MAKIALFPLLMIAGLYGALHNQISYTVSPDYVHAFKFQQFDISENLQGRVGASIVGWYASWWMGLLIGVPVLLVGLILPGVENLPELLSDCVRSSCGYGPAGRFGRVALRAFGDFGNIAAGLWVS